MPRPPGGSEPSARLGEPVSERFVGRRDLTRWSRLGRAFVAPVLSVSRYVSANTVLFVAALAGAALVSLLTWASAEIYDNVKDADGLSGLDVPALRLAMGHRTVRNVAVIHFFTTLGGPLRLTVITVVIVVIMTVVWRSRTPLLVMVIGVSGSLLMTDVGKDLVGRARPAVTDAVPPYETSPSFPSGHALNSTVIAVLLAYLLLLHLTSLLARIVTVVLAVAWFVAMGLSRVFLGYHWLTDVMVGWTLGLAWAALVVTSHRLYLTVRKPRPSQP